MTNATDIDDEDILTGALIRLAAPLSDDERANVFAVADVLVAYLVGRNASNARMVAQMAAVRRLDVSATNEEKLTRAARLVEQFAPRIAAGRDLDRFAKRIEVETAESRLREAMKDESARAFVVETFAKWTPGKPAKGKRSTTGVLADLARRFNLWSLAGSDTNVRDRIKDARNRASGAPSRKTRKKASKTRRKHRA